MKTFTILALIAGLFGTVPCMLFQYQEYQNVPPSCPAGIPYATLRELSQTVANTSRRNIFQQLLPRLAVERVSGTSGNTAVREFIKREMGSLGWTVEEDAFTDYTPYGNVNFSNVIATFNPSMARRVVVACHYDSKYMPGRVPFVAATDSAVPCAVMLDTARRLSQVINNAQQNRLNDFSLQFIFFDGEEAFVRWTNTDSLYGSRHLAQTWAARRDRNDPAPVSMLHNIELFILLDLIGAQDTKFVNHFSNTASHFNSMASIEQCLRESGLLSTRYPRTIFDRYGRATLVEDDHIPFLHRGVPILHLISTPFPSVWHTAQDDLAHLDNNTVDDFSRIFRLSLASLLTGV